jgi:PAS domain S-box-containing protein
MKKGKTAGMALDGKNTAPAEEIFSKGGSPAGSGSAHLDGAGPKKDLGYWRERILSALIGSGVVIGFFAVVPSVWLAYREGLVALAILDAVMYGLALVLFIGRRMPYLVRSLLALGLAYLLGVGICLSVGFMSAGPYWLFSFVVLSGVLLGLRCAVGALIFNMLTLSTIGWLIGSGALGPGFAFFRSTAHALVVGANYSLLNGLIAVTVSVLLEGLQDTADQQEATSRMLSRERSVLVTAKESLLAEVEHRKSTEAALRKSEERFREMAEHLPETIFEMDLNGKLTFVNQSAYEQFGYSPAEFADGLNAFAMIASEDRSRASKNVEKILSGDKLGITEYTAVRKDGTRFPAIFHSAAVYRGDVPCGVRGFIIDVSEKKRIEEQSYQTQRLEAIGTLAGGVAHDFNNLLMGIQGRASLLLVDLDPSHPGYPHLKGIEEHVASAAHLTNQLLGFARSGKYQVRVTDPNTLVEKTLDMFSRARKEIRIFRRFQNGLPGVEVDRGQIEQVLLNLFVNAWQAMDGGGKLYVETASAPAADFSDLPLADAAGAVVRISVTDTGIGMDPATRERIFEPFFTTRERGRGTGLGLATAYGIVRNHGGALQVFSEKGKGSTFHVYLPAVEKPVEEETGGAVGKRSGGVETILLVDDEEMIRDVGRQLLEKLGYEVLTAADGREALTLFQRHSKDIDLVILDMVMPEMGGKEVFEGIKALSDRVRVLLCSGYSIDGQAAEILRRGCDGFIQKPFNIEGISAKVREVLEKKE